MKPDTLNQLHVGAVVTLKSGGPAMTVAGWEDDRLEIAEANVRSHIEQDALGAPPEWVSVHCKWCDEKGRPHQQSYLAAMLKPY